MLGRIIKLTIIAFLISLFAFICCSGIFQRSCAAGHQRFYSGSSRNRVFGSGCLFTGETERRQGGI